jgi:hypothetical protein
VSLPAAALAVVSSVAASGQSSAAVTAPAGATPEKAAAEAQDVARHQALEAAAANAGTARASQAAKRADAATRALAAAGPAPQKWPEGIFQDGEAPASGSVFLGRNRWVGTLAGRSVAVYAGRAGTDDTIGRVLVTTAGPTMALESAYMRDLPGSGALVVTSAQGGLLTLTDVRGGTHVFDLAAERFRP